MPIPIKKSEVQEPPFAIQLELTEGCNLRCSFCGLNGIRGKENNFKFLSTDLATRIAKLILESGWTSRIEFAMHGEPSMNPCMVDILSIFRSVLPSHQMMMTSNGGGFLKSPTSLIDGVLESLNILAFDWYENVNIVPKLMESYRGQHEWVRYPQDPRGNPHRRLRVGERMLIAIQDIDKAEKGTHSTLNNHAGCGSPPNSLGQGKRCAKPFRELSIRWNGAVAICCNDWRGMYRCGDVTEVQSLDDLWQSPEFRAARRKLYHGQRDFGPCSGCDALSYRVGLLPDKKGKIVLPLPSQADLDVIEGVVASPLLTPAVLRKWELPLI